jgi:hypothetical protein
MIILRAFSGLYLLTLPGYLTVHARECIVNFCKKKMSAIC